MNYPTVCFERVDHRFCQRTACYIAVCGKYVHWLCEQHIEAFAHPSWKLFEIWSPHV